MSDVKRYNCVDCLIDYSQEEEFGTFVKHTDYELLKAKLDMALEALKYIGYSPTRDCKEPAARRIYEELSEGDK